MCDIRSFKSWPSTVEVCKHFTSYDPFHLGNCVGSPGCTDILNALQSATTLVEVSCASDNESFSGHPARREKVDLKTRDFAAAWASHQNNEDHWVLHTELCLYLSQCCIFCRSDPKLCELHDANIVQASEDHFHNLCGDVKVDQINLWMNIQQSQSTLHYDANHNLLVLLEGSKTVTLLSPSCTKYLSPASAADEHPNHSTLTTNEVDALAADIIKARTELASKFAGCVCYVVTIYKGDALFIPEGWWHQVSSEKCSMAMNYWFPSPLQAALFPSSSAEGTGQPNDRDGGVSMGSYILRAALHQLVQEEQAQQRQQRDADGVAVHAASIWYQGLSYAAFEQYVMHDLLPEVESQTLCVGDCSTLAGTKRSIHDVNIAPSTSMEPALERFVTCDISCMQRLWVPFAEKVGTTTLSLFTAPEISHFRVFPIMIMHPTRAAP